MKRVFLFIVTNLAVMLVLSITLSLLGVNRYMAVRGMDMSGLLVMAAVLGFGGAFISLAISTPTAKWTTGPRVIDGTGGPPARRPADAGPPPAANARRGSPGAGALPGGPRPIA